jgi:hypothetical protein
MVAGPRRLYRLSFRDRISTGAVLMEHVPVFAHTAASDTKTLNPGPRRVGKKSTPHEAQEETLYEVSEAVHSRILETLDWVETNSNLT